MKQPATRSYVKVKNLQIRSYLYAKPGSQTEIALKAK